MLILIKTPTLTFSLDVQPDDNVDVLFTKVAERTEYKRFQFDLLYAGDKLSKSTVAACGIKKESTIHMVVIKELKYTITYKGVEYNVALPNNDGLKIAHLGHQITSKLTSEIPDLSSSYVDIVKPGSTSVIPTSSNLQDYFGNYDTVEILLRPKYKAPVRRDSTSSESSSSDDDDYESKSKSKHSSRKSKFASKESSYTPPSQKVEPEEQFDKDALLASFVESSISSDVEIVFCFDTTGSMSSIINNVKKQVEKTVSRLMKDIPNIRIGIMGLGDYCDGSLVLSTLDLTQSVDILVSYIKGVKSTSGGDAPEAYEYALMKAKELSWSSHTSKAFVMIGDSNPHPPSFTDMKINWFKECDDLYEQGIKVYGVKALGNSIFYDEIAERTGGICINFNKFDLITEMFLAICYREASSKKFQQYQEEITSGEMGKEMKQILTDLNQTNFTVEMKKTESDTPATPKSSEDEVKVEEPTTTTTTTTTTTSVEEPAGPPKKVIQKIYGEPTYIKVHDPWYNIKKDYASTPSYIWDPSKGYFLSRNEYNRTYPATPTPTPSASTTSTVVPATLADAVAKPGVTSTRSPPLFSFTGPVEPKKSHEGAPLAIVIGDTKIGKTTFVRGISFVSKTYKNGMRYEEHLSMSRETFKSADVFVVCYDLNLANGYDNVPYYLQEIRKIDITKPIAIIGLKNDLPLSATSVVDFTALKQVFSLVGAAKYSQYLPHEEIWKISKSITPYSNSKYCTIM